MKHMFVIGLILFTALIIVLATLTSVVINKSHALNDQAGQSQAIASDEKSNGRKPSPADVDTFLAPKLSEFKASEKPVVNIELEPMADDDVMVSKVGGAAYWPEGKDYPKGSQGKPLFLLAQIRFDEMPDMPNYPKEGMLQFFIADTDYYGANIDGDYSLEQLSVQKDFRVVYWPALQQTTRMAPVASSDSLPHDPKKPKRMKFKLKNEWLSNSDFRFNTIFDGNYYEALEKYAAANGIDENTLSDLVAERFDGSGHKLGGYAFFTQEDPRDKTGMELLFQLDSQDELMWGDSGVGNFFIRPEDLQRRDFSRVAYHWDCY
jgi:uncharacterized protein YwqG